MCTYQQQTALDLFLTLCLVFFVVDVHVLFYWVFCKFVFYCCSWLVSKCHATSCLWRNFPWQWQEKFRSSRWGKRPWNCWGSRTTTQIESKLRGFQTASHPPTSANQNVTINIPHKNHKSDCHVFVTHLSIAVEQKTGWIDWFQTKGCTSGAVNVPCICMHARWELL